MKKRIAIIATAVIIVATLVVGGTLAFFTDKGTVTNVITMGDVHITLTEPTFESATNSTYKVANVMPNQQITKDPTITNTGSHDAYIRCKIAVTGLPEDDGAEYSPTRELLSGLNIDGTKWVQAADGYYYYQTMLPKKPADGVSAVKLFDTVTIPEQWDNTLVVDKDGFKISITAEAIQADNFTPHTTNDGTKDIINGWNYSSGSPVEPQNAPVVNNPN